jgi:hypothetical protein
LQAVDKIAYSNDWITILFLVLFASIVLLKLINARKMKESFFAFSNFSLFEEEDIEATGFFDIFQIVIYVFSITVLSLLVYHFKIYKAPESATGFTPFSAVFGGLLIYFVSKRILEYLLMLLFMIKRGLQFFTYLKNTYLYSVAFLIYIALIFAEYSSVNHLYLFFFAGFLFFLRLTFLIVRNKKLIFNKLFYFILYICALEIAPLFVLFKLMF